MNNHPLRLWLSLVFCATLLVSTGSACSPSLPKATKTPIVQRVEVTQIVTRDVTMEVTRVIEIPVTVTTTFTPEFSLTPSQTPTLTNTPSITSTPELPTLTLLEYVNCLYGPGDFYLYKTSYPAGNRMEVVGRSFDHLWINIQDIHGWNSCWIPANQARLEGVSVDDLPFVYTALPLARYEYASPTVKAIRTSITEVTLTWERIWMSKDELRGYLIEAWVCQDGQYIFLPVSLSPTYEENVDNLSVIIKDEPGCAETSRARIATVVKKGYTPFEKIFWPVP